jgi:hypothetical protein
MCSTQVGSALLKENKTLAMTNTLAYLTKKKMFLTNQVRFLQDSHGQTLTNMVNPGPCFQP